jgi:hypothetical protein
MNFIALRIKSTPIARSEVLLKIRRSSLALRRGVTVSYYVSSLLHQLPLKVLDSRV